MHRDYGAGVGQAVTLKSVDNFVQNLGCKRPVVVPLPGSDRL